jgi:aldehyde dehydrogenase (NAD+)
MREYLKFYIEGRWVDPVEPKTSEVINPATEAVSGRISMGSAADVEKAVRAARKAFASWSNTSRKQRLQVMQAIKAEYEKRQADIGAAITEEMGAPAALGNGFHVFLGAGHLDTAIEVLKEFKFEEQRGSTLIVKEPIGVCALITPWNWPLNQIAVKLISMRPSAATRRVATGASGASLASTNTWRSRRCWVTRLKHNPRRGDVVLRAR